MTIRYTPTHSLPYPEGSDSVAPASRDFKDLALNTDAALTAVATISEGKLTRQTLPPGPATNLDTLTEPGLYGYWSSSTNIPSDSSGMLVVNNLGSETNTTQVAFEYGQISGGAVWSRFRGSVSWSPWVRIGGPQSKPGEATPTALKTAPMALSASSSTATEAVAAGAVRFPVRLNAPVTRWRLHVRNYNDRTSTAYNAGASFTGLWVGQRSSGAAFSAAPTQVTGPFTLPADGSEVVTPWSSVPLGDDVDRLISLGWTGATGPNTQSPAGAYRSTSSTTGGATSGAGYTKTAWVPFSWWIEVQAPATTPLVAMWGDSITAGTGNDLVLYDSPLSQYARTIGAIPIHHAFPGTGMVAWTADDTHQWTRWSHLSPADAVIHFMGQNDLEGAGSLAGMQQRFNDTIDHLKTHVSGNVYLATLTPHAGKSSAINTVRKNYNAWLKTLPGGALDVFDFSAAVGNAADTALLSGYDSGDGLHLSTAGSTALAAAITRPVTTTLSGSGTSGTVTSVNGVEPDETGNVEVSFSIWDANSLAIARGFHEVMSATEPTQTTYTASNGQVYPVVWVKPIEAVVPVIPGEPVWADGLVTVEVGSYVGIEYRITEVTKDSVTTPVDILIPSGAPLDVLAATGETLPVTVKVDAVALPGYYLPAPLSWLHAYPDPSDITIFTSDGFSRGVDGDLVGSTTDAALGGSPVVWAGNSGLMETSGGALVATGGVSGIEPLRVQLPSIYQAIEFDLTYEGGAPSGSPSWGVFLTSGEHPVNGNIDAPSITLWVGSSGQLVYLVRLLDGSTTPIQTIRTGIGTLSGHYKFSYFGGTLTVETPNTEPYVADLSALDFRRPGRFIGLDSRSGHHDWSIDNVVFSAIGT